MTDVYEVELIVPLGVRHGTMTVRSDEKQVSGDIEIMGHKTAFAGARNADGFVVEGVLQTAVKEIAYKGIGTFGDGQLSMRLENANGVYMLRGLLRKEPSPILAAIMEKERNEKT